MQGNNVPNDLQMQTLLRKSNVVVSAKRFTCVLMKLWLHIHRELCWFFQLVRFPEVETVNSRLITFDYYFCFLFLMSGYVIISSESR